MLNLHLIQAEYGDCLLVEFQKQDAAKFILVDGGPKKTYNNHLIHVLEEKIPKNGLLDLVVISHIDNDHINGIIRFLENLKIEKQQCLTPLLRIGEIWHNTFQQNIGIESGIAAEVLKQAVKAENKGLLYSLPQEAVRGFSQGEQVVKLAEYLKIGINDRFKDRLILDENAPAPLVMDDDLKIWIVGPNRRNLERLQTKWLEWLDKNVNKPVMRDAADTSVPNLSSIILLVESGGRKILLTGDGTGDEILEGLKSLGKLDAAEHLHVDVLKLPHHGSNRTVDPAFFDKVTANLYVISGKENNPDLETLEWIVNSAQRQRRSIQIVATNETDATKKLLQQYDPQACGYTLTYLQPGQHYVTV